jgi:very-short-patch-repair endonuclease
MPSQNPSPAKAPTLKTVLYQAQDGPRVMERYRPAPNQPLALEIILGQYATLIPEALLAMAQAAKAIWPNWYPSFAPNAAQQTARDALHDRAPDPSHGSAPDPPLATAKSPGLTCSAHRFIKGVNKSWLSQAQTAIEKLDLPPFFPKLIHEFQANQLSLALAGLFGDLHILVPNSFSPHKTALALVKGSEWLLTETSFGITVFLPAFLAQYDIFSPILYGAINDPARPPKPNPPGQREKKPSRPASPSKPKALKTPGFPQKPDSPGQAKTSGFPQKPDFPGQAKTSGRPQKPDSPGQTKTAGRPSSDSLPENGFGDLDLVDRPDGEGPFVGLSPQSGIGPEPRRGERVKTKGQDPDVSIDEKSFSFVGKPHPNSGIEKKLAKALARDERLMGFFLSNQKVETKEKALIVDFYWPDGGLVVEADGYAYHKSFPAFSNDRHRDYLLNLAGKIVLRLTGTEIYSDINGALEKIHNMVVSVASDKNLDLGKIRLRQE